MDRQLKLVLVGSTFDRINVSEIKSLLIAIPPRVEQDAIVDYLDEAFEYTNGAISTADREIELLREYRTRLIADVVTGKLDVREAAARLPDEPDEAEPLDEADLATDDDESEAAELEAIPSGSGDA